MIDVQTSEQMVITGHEQLEQLESGISTLRQQKDTAQSELVTLRLGRQQRAEQLEARRKDQEHATGEHEQAIAYARLAHGTIAEHSSIKEVTTKKKALDAVRKQVQTLEQETRQQDQEACEQEERITKLLLSLQSQIEQQEEELSRSRLGHDQAHKELGQARYDSFLLEYEQQQQQVNALLEQLIAAQAEAQNIYDQTQEQLAAWPELQKKMSRCKQQEDAVTQMLQATMLYIEISIREVNKLPADFPQAMKARGFLLWNEITVHPDELFNVARYPQQNAQQMRQRLTRLHQALADYRSHLES